LDVSSNGKANPIDHLGYTNDITLLRLLDEIETHSIVWDQSMISEYDATSIFPPIGTNVSTAIIIIIGMRRRRPYCLIHHKLYSR
jgi:hypothetical protein